MVNSATSACSYLVPHIIVEALLDGRSVAEMTTAVSLHCLAQNMGGAVPEHLGERKFEEKNRWNTLVYILIKNLNIKKKKIRINTCLASSSSNLRRWRVASPSNGRSKSQTAPFTYERIIYWTTLLILFFLNSTSSCKFQTNCKCTNLGDNGVLGESLADLLSNFKGRRSPRFTIELLPIWKRDLDRLGSLKTFVFLSITIVLTVPYWRWIPCTWPWACRTAQCVQWWSAARGSAQSGPEVFR